MHAGTGVEATQEGGVSATPTTAHERVEGNDGDDIDGSAEEDGDDGDDDDDDDDDDDEDDGGSEDTPSEDTDADSDVDGASRRDEADGAPSARTRQSPRLAELEANGAAGTTKPRNNTTTHQSGSE